MRPMLAALALLLPAISAAAAKPTKIAVMDIKALGTEPHLAELLSEMVLSELGSVGGLDVIGKSDVSAMLGFEKQRQLLGCTDASCLAEIGGALGVNYVLVGSIGKLGRLYRVDLKLIDAHNARAIGRVGDSVEGAEEALAPAVQRLTRQLVSSSGVTDIPPRPPVRDSPSTSAAGADSASPAASAPLAPAVEAPKPTPPQVTQSNPPEAKRAPRTAAWVVLGSGGVLLATGGVFGALALSSYSDEKAASKAGDGSAYDSARAALKKQSTAADVLFATGAVASGVGLYLLLRDPDEASATPMTMSVRVGQSSAAVCVAGGF